MMGTVRKCLVQHTINFEMWIDLNCTVHAEDNGSEPSRTNFQTEKKIAVEQQKSSEKCGGGISYYYMRWAAYVCIQATERVSK